MKQWDFKDGPDIVFCNIIPTRRAQGTTFTNLSRDVVRRVVVVDDGQSLHLRVETRARDHVQATRFPQFTVYLGLERELK